MPRNTKIYFYIISILLWTSTGWSQWQMSEDTDAAIRSSHYQSMQDLKSKAATMLADNKHLEVEFELLQREYAAMLEQFEGRREEIEARRRLNEQRMAAQPALPKRTEFSSYEEGIEDNHNAILIQKSRNSLLSAQLIDREDETRLYKLQLSDLEFQRRDLELERNYKKFQVDERQRKQSVMLDELRAHLQYNLEKEKELDLRIQDLEKASIEEPRQINTARQNIERLTRDIASLEKKIGWKVREVATLKDRRLLETKSAENMFTSQDREKVSYDDIVRRLETEYQALNQKVLLSLDVQDQRRKILNDIIDQDKQNQTLREKISQMQQRMAELKDGSLSKR